jgi:hypothetical protein
MFGLIFTMTPIITILFLHYPWIAVYLTLIVITISWVEYALSKRSLLCIAAIGGLLIGVLTNSYIENEGYWKTFSNFVDFIIYINGKSDDLFQYAMNNETNITQDTLHKINNISVKDYINYTGCRIYIMEVYHIDMINLLLFNLLMLVINLTLMCCCRTRNDSTHNVENVNNKQ